MKNYLPALLLVTILLAVAAVGCGKVTGPAAATVEPGTTGAAHLVAGISGEEQELVGYARNVVGTIQIKRGETVFDLDGKIIPLYDDDQARLVSRNARFDVESALADVPVVTIRQGDEGYWNAETGQLCPPAPDWSYSRGISYAAYW